ncbi:MAG: oligosaccharide flippase family protein [Patulibacter sp.]|nr:oligosaccharide flippase family protein [Patulibacter sp.]
MTAEPESNTPGEPETSAPVGGGVDPGDGVAQQVVSGGVIRTVGFAITNLIALVAAIILARYLSPADFGRYGSVMALITIIYGITDGGLNTVGTRELSLRPAGDERRALVGVLLGIRMLLSAIGVGLAVLIALGLSFSTTMIIGTAIAGIGAVGTAAFSTLTLPALVELKNLRLLSVEVARQIVQLIATLVAVAAGYGLIAFYGVQAVVGPAVVVLLPVLIGAGVLVRPRYARAEWVHMVRVALPIAVAGVLSTIYTKVTVLVGSQTLLPGDQGLLVMTTRATEILSGLPLLVVGVALPVVSLAARDDRDRLRYVGQRLLESAMILGILISLPLSFGAKTVLQILGGDEFVSAAPALQIQAWVLLTVFVVQGGVVLLIALHRHRQIVIANTVGLTTVFVAGAILLPAYGVKGGSIAIVGADAVLAILTLAFVNTGDFRRELSFGAAPRILA